MNTTIIQNNYATGANCGEGSNVKPLKSISIISQAAALSKPSLTESHCIKPMCHALQKNAYSGVKAGYNQTSLKQMQRPDAVNRFFCSPNLGKRASMRAGIRTALGELGNGNVPAVICGESSPTFLGGSQSQTNGGHHG